MSRDDAHLHDALEAARLACRYVAGLSREQFLAEVEKQDAVIRRLEILGEAARRLSEAARARLPQVPWRPMIGMRNILAHDYGAVDLEAVWRVVTVELPPVIAALEAELRSEAPETEA
jgi:uncharacterized protein with HEPN domain